MPNGETSLDSDSTASVSVLTCTLPYHFGSRTVNGCLGGAVWPDSWKAIPSDHRSNEDNCSGLVAAHVREERPGCIQGSEDVRVELCEPLIVTTVTVLMLESKS